MTILIFLAVLVLLILVHEFGHFIVAKKSGIRVDEFGVGFPPKIFGKKYGETEYTLNWLPIGGFVKIWGEDPTEDHYNGPDSERSFVRKPRYIQAAVLVAGVAMNVLLAFVLYIIAFMVGMPTAVEEGHTNDNVSDIRLLVTGILPNTPAAEILKPSDEIVTIQKEGEALVSSEAIAPSAVSDFISQSVNEEIHLQLLRRGETVEVTVTPEAGIIADDPNRAAAGFSMSLVGTEKLPFLDAITTAGVRTYHGLIDITVGLSTLAVQAVRGDADLSNIAGPVGIVNLVGDAAALGFTWLLTFTAFISLNLAVINLLPIPALDGGRLVFVAIESVIRRPIKPIVATRMNQIGFILLLSLMALVTVNDVLRLVG